SNSVGCKGRVTSPEELNSSSTMNPSNMNELDMEEETWAEVPKGINTIANLFGDFPLLTKVTSPRPFGDKDASNVHNIDDVANKDSPGDPIVQLVDINTKSTSYAGVVGSSTMAQPQVSSFRPLAADHVFNDVIKPIMLDSYTSSMCKDSWGRSSFARCLIKVNSEANLVDVVTIGIPSLMGDDFTKETIRVMTPIVSTSNVVTPIVEKANDGFQAMGKKKKRQGKSKSTNGGQFAGPVVKQNVRYEPKANTSAPKKRATNVDIASNSSSMLKSIGTSSNNDNITSSNSFSALNVEEEEEEEEEEEVVENLYDETANLFPNTKTDGGSSFTADNSRLFKKKKLTADQIVQLITSLVRMKLVTFKFKKMTTRYLTPTDITSEGFNIKSCVADLVANGGWLWPQAWLLKALDLGLIPVPSIIDSRPDLVQWRDLNGVLSCFCVGAAWEALRPRGVEVSWYRVVWFSHCIPRHAFHLWLVMRNSLKTQAKLRQWDVGVGTDLNLLQCAFCSCQLDSHAHLFFECLYSLKVWQLVRPLAGMKNVPTLFA
nr:hypothetical protein [Tanacetum cinerariifolium]